MTHSNGYCNYKNVGQYEEITTISNWKTDTIMRHTHWTTVTMTSTYKSQN